MMVVPRKAASADQQAKQGEAKHRGRDAPQVLWQTLGWKQRELTIVQNHPDLTYIMLYDIYLMHGNTL